MNTRTTEGEDRRKRRPQSPGEMMRTLAEAMPWLFSAFLHTGIFLIMVFTMLLFTQTTEPPTYPTISGVAAADNRPNVTPKRPDDWNITDDSSRASGRQWTSREYEVQANPMIINKVTAADTIGIKGTIDAEIGKTNANTIFQISRNGHDLGPNGDGDRDGNGDGGDKGGVSHVVYVIDRSGSMVDIFDAVRRQLAMSIGTLGEKQDFHVIFFADGPPKEMRTGRLVNGEEANKVRAVKFLESVIAVSAKWGTDPIPSLQRAFDILGRADKSRPGKLIFLMTDGNFMNNEKVLRTVRRLSKNRNVYINTLLYGYRPPEAVRLLKQISTETGGTYKYISPDEMN